MISEQLIKEMNQVAKLGCFQIHVRRLSCKSIKELEQVGFKAPIPKAHDCSTYQKITWMYAKVKCDDINSLDENDEKYSLAQKLWIISKKAKNHTYE